MGINLLRSPNGTCSTTMCAHHYRLDDLLTGVSAAIASAAAKSASDAEELGNGGAVMVRGDMHAGVMLNRGAVMVQGETQAAAGDLDEACFSVGLRRGQEARRARACPSKIGCVGLVRLCMPSITYKTTWTRWLAQAVHVRASLTSIAVCRALALS
eukprot:1159117-Pelagomonas_calceolata.AAC.10